MKYILNFILYTRKKIRKLKLDKSLLYYSVLNLVLLFLIKFASICFFVFLFFIP